MSLQRMAKRASKRELGRPLEEVFVDPASIVLYYSIITKAVKLLKRCKEAHEVSFVADNPTKKELATIKKIVRREVGWREYFKRGRIIVNVILEEGRNASNEELRQIYREV